MIQVHLGQLKIGTWDIAQSIGLQHRSLKGVLDRYLDKNIGFALIMNHPSIPMSLHTFVLFFQGSETEYFQKLEECLKHLKSVQEIDIPNQ